MNSVQINLILDPSVVNVRKFNSSYVLHRTLMFKVCQHLLKLDV